MKKSEMLGKVWEILYKNTDLEEEGLKTLSEQILECVEDNGMSPPEHFFTSGERADHYLQEWENE